MPHLIISLNMRFSNHAPMESSFSKFYHRIRVPFLYVSHHSFAERAKTEFTTQSLTGRQWLHGNACRTAIMESSTIGIRTHDSDAHRNLLWNWRTYLKMTSRSEDGLRECDDSWRHYVIYIALEWYGGDEGVPLVLLTRILRLNLKRLIKFVPLNPCVTMTSNVFTFCSRCNSVRR